MTHDSNNAKKDFKRKSKVSQEFMLLDLTCNQNHFQHIARQGIAKEPITVITTKTKLVD